MSSAEWAVAHPNYDLGAHVGQIGVLGETYFYGDGANLTNLAKGATGNACQVLPRSHHLSIPSGGASVGFNTPFFNSIAFSAMASWGTTYTSYITGSGLAISSLGRIQPNTWYYSNSQENHLYLNNLPIPELFRDEQTNPVPGQTVYQNAPVFIPSVMLGGKFHFRLKCLIYINSATTWGGNWDSISGSTIEILPSLWGIDGNVYDAPDPAGKAVISDPFNGDNTKFFMAEWNFEWDLTAAGAPTQPYDLRFKARFNTSATFNNLGVTGMAFLGLGLGTMQINGSQTPAHIGNLKDLSNTILANLGYSLVFYPTVNLESVIAMNRLALWTTET
jgi:hypothetical protein